MSANKYIILEEDQGVWIVSFKELNETTSVPTKIRTPEIHNHLHFFTDWFSVPSFEYYKLELSWLDQNQVDRLWPSREMVQVDPIQLIITELSALNNWHIKMRYTAANWINGKMSKITNQLQMTN